jgi:hypothetical protein
MSMKTYYAARCDKCGEEDESLWDTTREANAFLVDKGWLVDGDDHICNKCHRKLWDTPRAN